MGAGRTARDRGARRSGAPGGPRLPASETGGDWVMMSVLEGVVLRAAASAEGVAALGDE